MEKIGNDYHIPVLYYETLDNLVINPDGVYIDCTLGGGSHSEGILERLSDKGLLLSIDQDSTDVFGTQKKLPDSIFTDFNKPESEMTAGYDMMHPLFDQRDTSNSNPFFDEEY